MPRMIQQLEMPIHTRNPLKSPSEGGRRPHTDPACPRIPPRAAHKCPGSRQARSRSRQCGRAAYRTGARMPSQGFQPRRRAAVSTALGGTDGMCTACNRSRRTPRVGSGSRLLEHGGPARLCYMTRHRPLPLLQIWPLNSGGGKTTARFCRYTGTGAWTRLCRDHRTLHISGAHSTVGRGYGAR